jgi:hypothetical protein
MAVALSAISVRRAGATAKISAQALKIPHFKAASRPLSEQFATAPSLRFDADAKEDSWLL